MAVSIGMFPQKTHLFTAMLCHQFLQQLWRDCNFESIMMQHHPNQNSCLSDSVLYLPMNLICGCVWKPPNQSWIYRTSSQGLNKDHLVMESRKTNHPMTFNWNNKINQHNTSDFYLNTSTLMWFWPGQIAQAFDQKVSKSMEPEQ